MMRFDKHQKWVLVVVLLVSAIAEAKQEPLRMAVVGLVHGHAAGFFRNQQTDAFNIVGLAEPDTDVAKKYIDRFKLDLKIYYQDLNKMLKKTKPQAVAVFTSTKTHREVVEICAPLGIHIMVEKPLAVSLEDARIMAALARKHNIHLLTNYETTWYPTTQETLKIEARETLGPTRKIIVRDGHRGPVEINVQPEFLDWLIDPVRNGGGSLMDFGCYGANLITAMMDNRRPLTVTAVAQQIKPDIYPQVEDESTIILTYPSTHCIIQASWNWPINRKDMELYGKTGGLRTVDKTKMFVRADPRKPEQEKSLALLAEPMHNPYAYFAAVVRGDIDPKDSLSSVENNLITMEILEAARDSVQTGKTVHLSKNP
ncbi:Gfo/Idh/MocA family protein [Planctomycetota bacterium]